MAEDRFFCADLSRAEREPLAATASRIDHWLLVEYRGLWGPNAIRASGLSDQVKDALREQVRARPRSRLLFVRRPDRRGRPALRAYAATSLEGHESLRCHAFEEYDELRGLDLAAGGEVVSNPLFVVCTHGKHDPCCARYGRPLFEALAELVDEEWVWQSTHVGGDRFAGNVVCLPHGTYYGRLDREDAVDLLDAHLAGRVALPNYRGRSTYTFAEQAAERSIREDEEILALDGLRLRAHAGTNVVFEEPEGRTHERRVVEVPGEPRRLTCSSKDERRPARYRVSAPA
jgi:hypothetical protein